MFSCARRRAAQTIGVLIFSQHSRAIELKPETIEALNRFIASVLAYPSIFISAAIYPNSKANACRWPSSPAMRGA